MKIHKSEYYENSTSQSCELVFSHLGRVTFISDWNSLENDMEDQKPTGDIKNFEDFQNANIAQINEEIKGLSPEESLKKIEDLQSRFSYEIWLAKEKSFAAQVLKNQISKMVLSEKQKILPEYNPANLSKASRTPSKKHKTTHETERDKLIAKMKKLGIDPSAAEDLIASSIKQTFELGINKPLPVNTFTKCESCGAFSPLESTECMICGTTFPVKTENNNDAPAA